jgi:hypothetical protein
MASMSCCAPAGLHREDKAKASTVQKAAMLMLPFIRRTQRALVIAGNVYAGAHQSTATMSVTRIEAYRTKCWFDVY